ncbi:RagB/SusD family nutrient uptake outer membrane protein [Zobellia galactanivorans]|uniref:SusD/RagB family lipoprotein n=1 Tax=Zobellia galactanivorans (strain DSM 12802 / CCUG 47099 / CIP 106680 / NCIMB 13871 / Dsij) TaxID=63186 RepID=G0LA54_ZOBGA|nr:RagB/SusD family nutrient uptake outer membrane protein [Zobellia galactanivorans]CAZ95061.1 SusD/RagB family lipoprotein [Zobellia galactanivorans]
MNNIKFLIVIFAFISILVGCNEDKFLEEKVYDFYSPENSYTTPDQIDLAVVKLYEDIHTAFYASAAPTWAMYYLTDVAYDAISTTHRLNSWADNVTPEAADIGFWWDSLYKIISNANTIIDRIEYVEYQSEQEKLSQLAEAKFFRAYAYRTLAIMYGGVPISLEEITTPKRDFVRASRDEVLQQVLIDLNEAAANLPDINNVKQDGRVSKAAANHLLTEVHIMLGDYNQAIVHATSVIDNPNFELMTSRFGSRISEPGDVFWDLFQIGNVNRGSGNTETIWASQYEHLAPGGGAPDDLARFLVPQYWQLQDVNGDNVFFGHSSQNGGRGIGWWVASDYMLNQIWVNSNNDIRNSDFNIIRDLEVDNPNSAFFGQMMVASGAIEGASNELNGDWSAIFAKSAPIGNFPDDVISDPETGATNNGARSSFRDRYLMRLAETYLLRAEAYYLNGDSENAANDINALRFRANADQITASEVDLNTILDERARELFIEEFRLLTLMRMNKLVERVRIYNPMHNGFYSSNPINDTQNLWPIPNKEIERNTEATLEQNPGY